MKYLTNIKKIFYLFMAIIATEACTIDDGEHHEQIIQESNQIFYTSEDGNIVEPYDPNAFGAKIISNVYQDGLGIITFNSEVLEVGPAAFKSCRSLTNISIPDCAVSIGSFAFWGCTSLANVKFNSSIRAIGDLAFNGCCYLKSIKIPDTVTNIGDLAFWQCERLSNVSLPKQLTHIGLMAFAACSYKSIIIPDGVISIGGGAFSSSPLTSVNIPDSVTEIGIGVFEYCNELSSFTGKFASDDNRCLIVNEVLHSFAPAGLTSYSIPDSVKRIGDEAFLGCKSIESIKIPYSVTKIGNSAFAHCESLKSVQCLRDTPPMIYHHVFDNTHPDLKITVPIGSKGAYKSWWSVYAHLIY